MQILSEIKIPKETVNDDLVRIIKWLVNTGDTIKKGDLLVEVETSKAMIDIEAEFDGRIEVLFPENSEVPVGEIIGRILSLDSLIEKPSGIQTEYKTSEIQPIANTIGVSANISNKAKLLMQQHGIDASVFVGKSFVKENDVLEYIKSKKEQLNISEQNIPETKVNANERAEHDIELKQKKSIWAEAKNASKARGKSILWLAFNYIFRNWLLTILLKVAPYGVNIWLHRLRGVKIGNGCFIDPSAVVETAHPGNISIGNDVRIAAHAIIMTHIKAPVLLREAGYVPLVLKPVVLEDSCFIGVNAVVMPGVVIGKGAVVASGAVVLTNVPAFSMVSGNPAKVIKQFKKASN